MVATTTVDDVVATTVVATTTVEDDEYNKNWGNDKVKAKEAWDEIEYRNTKYLHSDQYVKPEPVVVAVLDTGVDYNHPDLKNRMWRNPGETGTDANGQDKCCNGIDDDGNGYTDDVHGYDTVDDDGDPMDD